MTLKTAQVHHLHPEEYDNLREDWFKVLSPTAHDFIEHVARILHGKTEVPNREALLAWIGPFLPTGERQTFEPVKPAKVSLDVPFVL